MRWIGCIVLMGTKGLKCLQNLSTSWPHSKVSTTNNVFFPFFHSMSASGTSQQYVHSPFLIPATHNWAPIWTSCATSGFCHDLYGNPFVPPLLLSDISCYSIRSSGRSYPLTCCNHSALLPWIKNNNGGLQHAWYEGYACQELWLDPCNPKKNGSLYLAHYFKWLIQTERKN